MNKATALDNRIRGITKEDYERQEYEVSTMDSEKLARLLEYIARGYIGDYNFIGTDEDFENHLQYGTADFERSRRFIQKLFRTAETCEKRQIFFQRL